MGCREFVGMSIVPSLVLNCQSGVARTAMDYAQGGREKE